MQASRSFQLDFLGSRMGSNIPIEFTGEAEEMIPVRKNGLVVTQNLSDAVARVLDGGRSEHEVAASVVPPGLVLRIDPLPPLKRWAMLGRPSGGWNLLQFAFSIFLKTAPSRTTSFADKSVRATRFLNSSC